MTGRSMNEFWGAGVSTIATSFSSKKKLGLSENSSDHHSIGTRSGLEFLIIWLKGQMIILKCRNLALNVGFLTIPSPSPLPSVGSPSI